MQVNLLCTEIPYNIFTFQRSVENSMSFSAFRLQSFHHDRAGLSQCATRLFSFSEQVLFTVAKGHENDNMSAKIVGHVMWSVMAI
jgi:hypothetical protein